MVLVILTATANDVPVGGGVVDRLRELGLPVRGVNVGEAPALGKTLKGVFD